MRVLHFAPRVCWPLDTGAKLRNYHLARILSGHAHLTLLAFTDQEEQPSGALEEFYEQVSTVPRDAGYTFPKILRGVLGRTPLPVLNYTTAAMKQALARTLSAQQFDIVQVESIHLMAYLSILRAAQPRPLVVCDWHNIESELMQRYSERESNAARRAYARKTVRLMSDSETRALQEFDAHVAVSQRDAEKLREINSQARVFVIENGVDTSFYSDEQIEIAYRKAVPSGASGEKNRIVFVGSMDYHANVDGVVNFAREIWPQVRGRLPGLTFTIVGRDPAPEIRELAAMPGLEVTGTIDDVRPFYREAAAAVVPLKVGGGSRLKILEAMAAGVPVVSTTLGAEGLNVKDGENILIADTDRELLDAIRSVVEDEVLRQRLSAAGRTLVSNHYDWSRLGTNLFEVYQQLLGG